MGVECGMRKRVPRDHILDVYVAYREAGHNWLFIARVLNMNYGAFERAMFRARADRDPRAGRHGEVWPPEEETCEAN